MKDIKLRLVPHPGRDAIALEIVEDGEALAHAFLEAVELDHLIAELAEARASLTDRVADALEPNARVTAIVNPSWRVPAQHSGEGKLLALRHPGLGWLSFDIPDDEAASMARWLAAGQAAPDTSE